jgi:ATP-dependent Clp protease ATP-binding subunit ClpA
MTVLFSHSARNVLANARHHAEAMGHAEITAGHLLLGLLKDAERATPILSSVRGLKAADVEALLLEQTHTPLPQGKVPGFDAEVRRILALAGEMATEQRQSRIAVETFVHALLDAAPNQALTMLTTLNIDADSVRGSFRREYSASVGDAVRRAQPDPDYQDEQWWSPIVRRWNRYTKSHPLDQG